MEEIAFPVLVGAALVEGVKFTYSQLGLFLERRRLSRQGEQPSTPEDLEIPSSIEVNGPLQLRDDVVEQHESEIQILHSLLRVSQNYENLDGREPQLRIVLGKAKSILDAVYGQEFRFGNGDDATFKVQNRLEDVHGKAVGADMGVINHGGHAEVDNQVLRVHESGEFTGARIDRVG
ncbi:V-type ATPase 116kDa subunit family protein [Micromonospora noduli]|uniref:V-type ATPase 116kDa subunit family protein n=1 Tax=Micromonospora noduli TaxID=709876 RepID=UPI0011BFDF61|nr:V-type ATPase 116kDa subunit family protein [Micromonospora noduli]